MFKADVSVELKLFPRRRETRLIPDNIFKALCGPDRDANTRMGVTRGENPSFTTLTGS